MVLGFQRRFAQYVREGSKTHSIREDKNDRWHPGVFVDAFVDPRQKTMERLIPSTPCIYTEPIEILPLNNRTRQTPERVEIRIDGHVLSADEMESLAWKDGFRLYDFPSHLYEMMRFWDGRIPFKGKVIHWKYPGPLKANA